MSSRKTLEVPELGSNTHMVFFKGRVFSVGWIQGGKEGRGLEGGDLARSHCSPGGLRGLW